MTKLHIVFRDFPGPDDRCVFVEVETPDGNSIVAGAWRKRADGLAELVIDTAQAAKTANCCECGRIVDTREVSMGGDAFGCELTDGRWTCSPECWETAIGDATPPQP